jgi:hypothetical protein
MTSRIKLVQGDTGPQIKVTLTDNVTNEPIDLTSATVTLHFRAFESATILFSRPLFINPDLATTGVCYIEWEDGDLNVEPGDYEGEIEIIRPSGQRETIYDLMKFRIRGDFA